MRKDGNFKNLYQCAAKAKAPVTGKSAIAKAKKDKTTVASKLEQDGPAMSDESLVGVIALENRWFSPKTIGAIFGLDEKWLSSVREGLKGIDGPPFKKLGSGKSAPICYNYGKFKEWFDNLPKSTESHRTLWLLSIAVRSMVNTI